MVAETDGVATEVSGAVGAVVGVIVCPVVTSGGSTRCGAPVMPPATPTPSTAVANPPMAPTPADINFRFRRLFSFALLNELTSRAVGSRCGRR
ncbi:hypothetical protein [Mycolicibacterium houstonense]|uniref:hypothetical protein n=1 Tax=Mycolicibacterium houstonense TaxID=146021 RepID=UPI0013593C26|nr:hypothetical protein [Mycolicibacterium houstonense]